MFFFLSKTLDVVLAPLTWVVVLAALSVPWTARGARRWRRSRLFGGAACALLLLASSPSVANRLLWWDERAALSTYHDDVVYDAVIILGGVGDERVWAATGQPSFNENAERVTVALHLLKTGHARVAIPSGGVSDERYRAWSEARGIAVSLEEWGVPPDRIVLEDQAKNTRENAVLSAAIVRARGYGRVLVVTSAFHVARAADCFRAVGLDVDFLPVDYRAHDPAEGGEWLPRSHWLDVTSTVIHEHAGRVVYRLRGYGKGP